MKNPPPFARPARPVVHDPVTCGLTTADGRRYYCPACDAEANRQALLDFEQERRRDRQRILRTTRANLDDLRRLERRLRREVADALAHLVASRGAA